MLLIRVLSALVLLPPVVAILLWGASWLLVCLALVAFVIINFEYYSFSTKESLPRLCQFTLISSLIPIGYLFYGPAGLAAGMLFGVISLLILLVLNTEAEQHEPEYKTFLPATALGFCYTGLLGSMLIVAADMVSGKYILWLLLVVICTDTFAYFGGSYFQGPKLAPRISPKKTISGTLSGGLGALVGAVLAAQLLLPQMTIVTALAFGLLTAVLAVFGDLAESLVKRTYAVKDTGTLIPGHGGLLDRLDAFLFALPLLFFFA